MKRLCEDSSPGDSGDPTDVASDVNPAQMESSFPRYDSPTTTMTTTTQIVARKRRRGIIEKRRRDRINSSLSELRRLVPPAVEKQASAKLEKAEILQMTVDHLKMLRARGNGAWDAQALAMDFLSLGFRECMWEVSRFLSVEGLDCLEPLRSRLLSHLTSCASQRHAAAASFTTASQLPVHQHLTPHWAIPPYGLIPQDPTGSSTCSPSSASFLSTSTQLFPIAVPALQPISSSQSPSSRIVKPYRPWGDEVGAL